MTAACATPGHDAAAGLSDGPAPGHAALWAAAALVAFSAHAGGAWWLMRTPPLPEVAIAGAPTVAIDISLLGSAPADQVSAGEAVQPVEPVETQAAEAVPQTVQPLEAKPSEAVETRPAQAETVQPALQEAAPPVETPVPSEVQIAAAPPVEPARPAEPEATPAAPSEEKEVAALPEQAPLPEARPRPKPEEAKPAAPKPSPKKAEKPAETRPAPQRAGNGGKSEADTRRGEADGAKRATATASNAAGASREAGNAAVSNYPGQIVSRLRRNLRYPGEARRQHMRGEVRVRFTVSSSGGVAGISVVGSSGQAVLDRAALETVRRAAPFPPIPAGAGRSSWTFTVPLAFAR